MQIEFVKADRLEDIAKAANEEISEGETKTSYMLAYELDAKGLIDNSLQDVAEAARLWSSEERPSELYFSHGEFRVGGLSNIIAELKEKPSSNRALYSLINQEVISGSGDNPIPSFIVFQAVLDGDALNCSVYFRALEVKNFLRVNLEEIRLNIQELSKSGLMFNRVKLMIFSARAHHTLDFNPLKKPELDRLSPISIADCLSKNPQKMSTMIIEKSAAQSVIEFDSLKHILEYLNLNSSDFPNISLLNKYLEESINISKDLADQRKKHSHDPRVTDLSSRLSDTLLNLAKAFES